MKKKQIKENNELMTQETINELFDMTKEFRSLMAYYRCAIMEVETKFRVLAEEYSFIHERNPISNIKTRLKDPKSIIEKLERRGFEKSVESIENNLFDIAGIRVICMFESDVYMLAQSLLMQDDITLIEKKDYISSPKPNGYRSMHLIVQVPIFLEMGKKIMKVEIQIRTLAMDCWAEIEHTLRYKKEHLFTDEMHYELKVCANLSEEMDKKMENIKKSILND